MKRSPIPAERFMVVAFTERQSTRTSYGAWPQHLTVVPWMRGNRLQATNRIVAALHDYEPLGVDITGEADFGSPVWLVGPHAILKKIHLSVLGAAAKYGTQLEDESYVGDSYRPHVTQKAGQPTHKLGDRLILPDISLIANDETLGKIVLQNISLQSHETAA